MRHLILLLVVGIALAGGTLPVPADNLERATSGDNVTVAVSSPFSVLPPGGCVPFRVNIRNDQNGAGTWRIFFQGSSNSSSGATILEKNLTVPRNSSASFELLVPLRIVSVTGSDAPSLNVGVAGPGFASSNLNNKFFAYFYTNAYSSSTKSAFTLIGKDILGPAGLGPLEDYDKSRRTEFYGSEVDAADLPSDWRAYSGVAAVYLKDSEWLGLNPTQREAVCDYVAQGGHLTLLTTEPLETKTPELQLPGPGAKPGSYGLGKIFLTSVASLPPDPQDLHMMISDHPARSAKVIDSDFSVWPLRQIAGVILVSGYFILFFVLIFGSLVGPINLYVFARGKNRFRLFWTTPLISLLASLFLSVGIFFTDGLGGSGNQMIAIYSLPGQNREAVIQEQVARTGVLWSSRWRNDQNYLITPVSEESLAGAMDEDTHGRVYHNYRTDLEDSPESYHQGENDLSGNWFRSRAVSGQYLQAVRPSRSALTVLNPAGDNAAQNPPVVLSSFPEELTKVYLIDQAGKYWSCDNLEPGRKQTCVADTEESFNQFWTRACANAGGKLRPLLSGAAPREGCFYATGIPSDNERLTTLSEIRWQVTSAVYLGPWVASPTPEKGP